MYKHCETITRETRMTWIKPPRQRRGKSETSTHPTRREIAHYRKYVLRMRQEGLAYALGVSQSTISGYEHGRNNHPIVGKFWADFFNALNNPKGGK